MRSRHRLTFALVLVSAFALGGSVVTAAPQPVRVKPGATVPKVKGVGPNVFTKRGVPAMKLSKSVKLDPLVKPPSASTSPSLPSGTIPIVAPFEGKVELSPFVTYVGSVGMQLLGGELRTIASPGMPTGFYVQPIAGSSIGISMPLTAAGSSDLMVSCEGKLPSTLTVWARYDYDGGFVRWQLMDLQNVTTKAKFVAVLDAEWTLQETIVSIGFSAPVDWPWRVDRCTVERV